ncbi:MAG: DUF3488 and transglutaminase-like domain-containing protein [Nibricoccus sp.]
MAKSRPQLELDELRQLKWLLGGLLTLISITSLLYLEINAWGFLVVSVVLVPLALVRPAWVARVPSLVHKLAFPGVVLYVAYDFYVHSEPLASMVRLDVLLLLYRSCHYRRRREDLQLIVLGLFLIVIAGVITVSMVFAAQIIAFVACGLLLLFVVTLVDAQEGAKANEPVKLNEAPRWSHRRWTELLARVRATCDWRVFALGGGLFLGFVLISGVLFMAIPRFDFNSGLAFDRMLPKKSHTGFSDMLRFGDVNDIQQDNSVVLRVEVSDRALVPTALYWRMVVLDEYREGTFRMSTALKASSFSRESTVMRIEGQEPPARNRPAYWTFYLEPVAGRYLPLTGGFRRLSFTEPQSVRYAPQLKLLMFGRDPVAMKAYRVEGMNTNEQLAGMLPPADFKPERLNPALSEDDRSVLQKTVATITGGATLNPEAFARAAMIWLAKQHGYSLKSSLPAGQNDPLVRWLVSREPGHCELFAASFALLARAAGHPTRVVAGYLGGTWNDDYLMVRNSDAHAWCEIFIGHGQWLRVDPTNDGPRLTGALLGQSTNSLRNAGKTWEARFDRLRMLWYRHIVNFDQADQQQLVRRLKESVEGTGRQIREQTIAFVTALKEWLARPWNFGRWARMAVTVLLGALSGFLILRALRRGWTQWRFSSGRTMDPVRREAGIWLQRLDKSTELGNSPDVQSRLQRLRYGRRETWPEPKPVFRAARDLCRGRRR